MGILTATLFGLATAWCLVQWIGRYNDRRAELEAVRIRALPSADEQRRRSGKSGGTEQP